MKIHLIRHGQSTSNIGENHSHDDTPLTEIGKNQVRSVARFFENKKVDLIYSSPLKRTRDTQKHISKKNGAPFLYNELLREVDHGIYTGKSREITEEIMTEKNIDRVDFRPEGGENYEDVRKRSKKFIEMLKSNHKDSDEIIIVSHGGFISMFLLEILGLPLYEKKYFGIKNCSRSTIEINRNWVVEDFVINETSHLLLNQ